MGTIQPIIGSARQEDQVRSNLNNPGINYDCVLHYNVESGMVRHDCIQSQLAEVVEKIKSGRNLRSAQWINGNKIYSDGKT